MNAKLNYWNKLFSVFGKIKGDEFASTEDNLSDEHACVNIKGMSSDHSRKNFSKQSKIIPQLLKLKFFKIEKTPDH